MDETEKDHQGEPIDEQLISRREFLEKSAYLPPAITAMVVVPEVTKAGDAISPGSQSSSQSVTTNQSSTSSQSSSSNSSSSTFNWSFGDDDDDG